MSGCPSFLPGQGKGVEVENDTRPKRQSLEIHPIFLYSQKSRIQKPADPLQAIFSLLLGDCPPDFQAVGGPGRPLRCRVCLLSCKMLKISVLQNVCILGKVTIGYLAK